MNFQIESKCTHTHTHTHDNNFVFTFGSRRAQWKISNGLFIYVCRLWTRKIITENIYCVLKNEFFFVEISSQHLNEKSRE